MSLAVCLCYMIQYKYSYSFNGNNKIDQYRKILFRCFVSLASNQIFMILLDFGMHRREAAIFLVERSSQNLLTVPRVRTETYGEKSFSCAAPRLWNNLPDSIKQCSSIDEFKAKLKTYLFRIAFTK